MSTEWQWYFDKLAGKPVEANESNPHAGFYRWPKRDSHDAKKYFVPVAYWPGKSGELNCRIGDDDVTPLQGRDLWVTVCDNPITEDAYRAVAERGETWPDEHEAVPMQGDNRPPEDNSFEGLQAAIDDLEHEAQALLEISTPVKDQNEADRIANLADRLAELHKKANAGRLIEKRPFDDGAEKVQQRWLPLLKKAKIYDLLKSRLLTPWLRRLDEAQKKEAEAAAAAGAPLAREDARRPRAGTRGRAMSLKTSKHARIDDYNACLAFFAESKEVRETVQGLANAAVRAGITVPGTIVVEETQAV